MRAQLAGALVMLTAALSLVACGGGVSGGSPNEIRYGSYVPLVGGFDPSLAQANQQSYLTPVYDTLLRKREDGTIVAGLASSYSYPSPKQLVLRLRRGITFTDGEPFDAAAVVANLDRTRKSGGNLSAQLKPITKVSAVDASTVRVSLNKPTTSLLATLADIDGMMAAPKAFAKLKTHPVGTGPWVYQPDRSSAGTVYRFTRNKSYWDVANRPTANLTVQVIQNYTSQLNGVLSGQLDVTAIQAEQVPQAKRAGLRVMSLPSSRLYLMLLDRKGLKVPALGKVEVRQAMNYAVDRDGITKALANGYGVSAANFFLPGYWPADAAAKDRFPYDPQKAKALLAAAGYPRGFSVAVGTIPVFQPYAEAIQQQFKAVGIDLRIHVLQNGVLAQTIRANTYPMVLTTGGGTSSGDPGTDVQQALLPMSPNNPEHYTDPQIVTLAKKGQALTTRAKRAPVYRQIDALATDHALNVVIGYQSSIVVSRPGVRGVVIDGCGGAACVTFTGIRPPK